jgi:hypothetical protein
MDDDDGEKEPMSVSPTLSLLNDMFFGTDFNSIGSSSEIDKLDSPSLSVTTQDGDSRFRQPREAAAANDSLRAEGPGFDDRTTCAESRPEFEEFESQKLNDERKHSEDGDVKGAVFIPLPRHSARDFGLSTSLPVGQLHDSLRFDSRHRNMQNSQGNSDTLLTNVVEASADGVVSPSTTASRSGSRFLGRDSSRQNSVKSAVIDPFKRPLIRFFSRQNSGTHSGTPVGSPQRYGSSIFGSKLFESESTTSLASQHVHIVAEATSIIPTLTSQCSVDNDVRLTPADVLPVEASEMTRTLAVRDGIGDEITADEVGIFDETLRRHRKSSHDSHQGKLATSTTAVNQMTNEQLLDEEDLDGVGEQLWPVSHVASTAASKRKWHQTMPDLVESPESDTLTAQDDRRKLAAAALSIIRDGGNEMAGKEKSVTKETGIELVLDERIERRRYMKNLLVLSTSFFLVFTSYLAIRNLQSSLNASGGLGLYSLSSLYASLFIGSMFTTTIVQRLGPKRSLAVSMISFITYNVANFFPRFYTLLPTSAILGFSLAVVWTSHATYLTNIALGYAKLTNAQVSDIVSRFNGIFFAFFQASQIVGGLISSLLLASSADARITAHSAEYDETNSTDFDGLGESITLANVTSGDVMITKICGSLYCPAASAPASNASSADPTIVLILMGIFLFSAVAGLATLIFFLDPLEGIMKSRHAGSRAQMTAVFRFFADRRAVCLLACSFYSLLQTSFMFGEYTKVRLHILPSSN